MSETLTVDTLGGLEIMPVEETMDYINLLVYGDPGVGKTVLAGSATEIPEMDPVIFVDVEGGTFSIRNRFPTAKVVRVASWHDMQKVYNELFNMNHGFKTVVLDSLTEIQKFSMSNIMKAVVLKDSDRDPDIPAMRDWGKNIEQIKKLVRGFRDLPLNTVFTALAKVDKDARTNIAKTSPYLSGKLSSEVSGMVDIVLYMYRKNVQGDIHRLLLSQATDQQIAKDRSDNLPEVIIDPDMKRIYDYVFGRIKKEEETE